MLDELQLDGPNWQTPAYQRGDGTALLAASREQGLAGVVAKRLDSTYQPGRTSPDWLRIENIPHQTVVIGGWLTGDHGAESLLVGWHESNADRLRYLGKVDVGGEPTDARQLRNLLTDLRVDSSPFHGRQPPRGATFVQPTLVCEVAFAGWTKAGTMRDPTYEGLRDDVPPADVVEGRTT